MTPPPQLVQDRTNLQQQRDTLEHRESVTTTVRLLGSVLRERADRVGRDAEPIRGDARIMDYLADLLEVHGGAGPGLSFLSGGLADFLQDHGTAMEYHQLGAASSPPFPDALEAYVAGSGSKSDASDAFEKTLTTGTAEQVAALAWFVDVHLHPIARAAVERTESSLRTTRQQHVDHLRDADEPNSGTNPLDELGWEDPVAMLPVRLETKFQDATPQGGTLQLRVYPDQLHVDTHEPELTEAEYEWGTAFWAQLWFVTHHIPEDPPEQAAVAVHDGTAPGNDAPPDRLPNDRLRRVVADLYDQLENDAFSGDAQVRFEEVRDRAWGRGVDRFGTERAAYVVHELMPIYGGSAIGEKLLAGPEANHWLQRVRGIKDFEELPEWMQVVAFLPLDDADNEWVLEQLEGKDALTDVEDRVDLLKRLGEALVEATQQQRVQLLFRLHGMGRLSGTEHDWLRRVFEYASPIRRPPALRFPEEEVAFRSASWTQPPRARLLPDRWVVYAYWDDARPNPGPSGGQWSTDWQSAGKHAWRRWDPDRQQWVKKVTGPAIREPLAVGPRPEAVAGDDSAGEAGMEWMLDFGEAKAAGMGLEFENPADGSWDGTPSSDDAGYDELVVTGLRTSGNPTRTADQLENLLAAQEYTQGLSFLEQGTPTNNADEPSGRSSSDDAAVSAPVKVGEPLVPLDGADRKTAVPLSGDTVTADGTRLATALGVPTDRFAHVEHADTIRHVDAGHVNDALWPATWGYYSRNLLAPDFLNSVLGGQVTGSARDRARQWFGAEADVPVHLSAWLAKFRDHFRHHVRGGGPLQTLRIGPQPYGILPVTPLAVDEQAPRLPDEPTDPVAVGPATGRGIATTASGPNLRYLDPDALSDGTLLTTLAEWVTTLRTTWLRSATGVPRIDDGAVTDQELLDLLSMEATPRTLRRQSWLLDDVSAVWELFDSNGRYQPGGAGSRRRPSGNDGAQAVTDDNISHLPWLPSPRIASMRFMGQSGVLADADDLVDDQLAGFLRALRGTLDDDLYAPLAPGGQGGGAGAGTPDPERWLDRLRALGGYWRIGWRSGIEFGPPDWFAASTPVQTPQRGTVGPWDDLVRPGDLTSVHPWLASPEDLSTSASVLRTLLHFATLREVAATRIRFGALYGDPLEMEPDPATYLGNETIYQELLTELGAGTTAALAAHPAVSGTGGGGTGGTAGGTGGTMRTPTYADAVRAAAAGVTPTLDQYLERFDQSLDHLSGMPPDDVEARAMETLGLASHRLDAWWTSIATHQLQDLRAGNRGTPASDGTLVGAFGFVEDLAPEPAETGEYLLAPSQNQVTTAAVLRSAHRAADDDTHADALAVDLSAERVRQARSLLDGVRNGRSVSAILGHRFEHRLRELTEDSQAPDLQQHLGEFRAAAPIKGGTANHRKGTDGKKGPEIETVTHSKRSDIVDGRRLLRAHRSGTLWTMNGLGNLGSTQQEQAAIESAVDGVLADFDDWMDAVNDVLTAEAVHQLSKGNPDRASAALEGLSRGEQLPPLEVLRTPRREAGVNNRLMVLFGDAEWRDASTAAPFDSRYALRKWDDRTARTDLIDPSNLPDLGGAQGQLSGGPSGKGTVGMRHVGEPNLNGWVGELLPQPDRVRCEASFQWNEERQFATGTFETPTEPGVVTVTDVGFEPDVLVFRVSNALGGTNDQQADAAVHGWTHGVFHDTPDAVQQGSTGPTQRSMSLAAPEWGAPEYATSDTDALTIAVPDDQSAKPGIRGSVDATLEDGFQVVFDAAADRSLVVQYQAIKTGDATAVRVGHFTTDVVRSAPDTQAINLDTGQHITSGGGAPTPPFDPDHVMLTASNAIKQPGAGTVGTNHHQGSLVGLCHGEAVNTGSGIDQQVVTSALDMAGHDDHAIGFRDDAALELLYGSGGGVTQATTVRVTRLERDPAGRPRLELEYQQQSDGTARAKAPAVVTYVAFESPTTESPEETTHRPTIGYVAAPKDEGGSITVDPGFDPGCVEVAACPALTASPGTDDSGSSLTVRTTTAGTAGWSRGVATDLTDQRVLSEAVRPVVDDSTTPPRHLDETVGRGSAADLVSITYLADDGTVAGRDVGRLTAMDDDGFTISFPDLQAASGSERPLLLYRAWPTAPEELPHATGARSVALQSLDLSPLDAVALSQVDAEPGLSQLERRLQYHLFRNRPANRPPVPDDADLELTFAATGTDDDAHVSFAEYLEAARSIRELLGDARPVDAEDLAHPADAGGAGYLPAGVPDESMSAAELRDRADEVQQRLEAAKAIVDNRRNLLAVPDDEANVCDRVDAIDRAVEAFCREVPARQVHRTAGHLERAHDPGNNQGLLDELQGLLTHVRAGPTAVATLPDDVVVETGGTRTITIDTALGSGVTLDIAAHAHSPGEHFATKTWTKTTDSDGAIKIDVDATGIAPGTRFVVVGQWQNAPPPLEEVLKRELRDLDAEDRAELFDYLTDAETFDEDDAEAVEAVTDSERFSELSTEAQIAMFLVLDRETKLVLLYVLDRDELAERYAEDEVGPPLVMTGRIVERDGASSGSLAQALRAQALVPRLLWLARHVEQVRPDDGSVGEGLADALAHSSINWNHVGKERALMSTIKPLTPADAFDDDDLDAVRLLDSLQHVDLSTATGLAGKLDAAVEPLERVGLTDFVGLTGPEDRPDDQRYWKRDECRVGERWERPCEGSVRARLRNHLRAPGWPSAPPGFERFAPEFQDLLMSGNLQPEHVFLVDALLQHPTGAIHAMAAAVAEPAQLLHDLNDLLYHPTELEQRVASGDLRARLESFARWLDGQAPPDDIDVEPGQMAEFAAYLRQGGVTELVQFVGSVPQLRPSQQQQAMASTYEGTIGTTLGDLRGSASEPGSTQHTIADRIAPAYTGDDLGPPFRRGVLETLRRGLLRASYAGIYGSTPNSTAGGSQDDQATLVDQAEVVGETLAERLDAASRAAADGDTDAVATQVNRLEALLGDDFVVLPPFAPMNPGELANTFDHSTELLDGDPYAVDTWLQRVARLRDRPAGFREALTYADLFDLAGRDRTAATGGSRDATIRRSLTVGQLPHGAGTGGGSGPSWVGLDGVQPEGGELSLAALFVSEPSGWGSSQSSGPPVSRTAGKPPMAGLFIDGWVTKVPDEERELGVGFRYDDPDARAPQSVLLAVPPSWSYATEGPGLQPTKPQTWSMDTLRTTLEEARDLIHARSVDLDALDALGHVLPAACFPYNEDSDLVPYQPEVFLPDAPSVLLDTFDWEILE